MSKTKIYFIACVASVLLFLPSPLAAKPLSIDFSVGNFGVSGAVPFSGAVDGSLWLSLGELYCVSEKTGIGFSFSPFWLEGRFSDAERWTAGDLSLRFVNCTLFHKTFPIYGESFLGPFLEAHWLGFDSLDPAVFGGVRLDIRGYSRRLFGKNHDEGKPSILFKLLTVDAGISYREGEFGAYLAVSTDALVALFALPAVAAALGDHEKMKEARDAADPYRKDGPMPEEIPADRKPLPR